MTTINEIIALAERAKKSSIKRIYSQHTAPIYQMKGV